MLGGATVSQPWVAGKFEADVFSRLVPKLHNCEDKALVGEVIGTLAEKGRASTVPGAKDVAKQILDTELPRLRLDRVNWWGYPNDGDGDTAEVQRFLALVEICLKSDFVAQAAELTKDLDQITQQRICEQRVRVGVAGSVPNLAHYFVRSLGNMLNEHQAPFMESVRDLFQHLLRNYALAPFPVYPNPSDGWSQRPRGCDVGCKHCTELNDFLISPLRKAAKFTAAKKVRNHISLQLSPNLFTCSLDASGRTHTLIVNKRSQDGHYRDAMAMYGARVRALGRYAEDFRHEHFRKILGDKLHRELVMLEIPGAPVQRAAEPGGVKREADDESSLPPALRRRLA